MATKTKHEPLYDVKVVYNNSDSEYFNITESEVENLKVQLDDGSAIEIETINGECVFLIQNNIRKFIITLREA